MTEPKHEETFKVVDRRLFSESGELRKQRRRAKKRQSKKDA